MQPINHVYIRSKHFSKCFLLGICFILFFTLSACLNVPIKSYNDFPFDAMMVVQDLPPGWFDKSRFPESLDVSGADSMGRIFMYSNDPQKEYMSVKHQLVVLPNEESARNAYPRWERESFPVPTWERPKEAQFVPKDANDQFRLGCLWGTHPYSMCRYLQQHSKLISLVLVNIDDQSISLAQFEAALKRVDERLQKY